ncbi:MAG: 50S ribosomal protein L20 [Planctomycetes bacterium]|nr:50S ribosomal protein L20 [Planctomycetota bacterium]
MRVTNAVPRHKRKKRLMRRARGMWGSRGTLLKITKETVLRADAYAYRDRKVRKRMFRRLWIQRLSAAAREQGLSYSQFMAGIHKAGISLDRKQMSEMAIHDPSSFSQLVSKAKAAL